MYLLMVALLLGVLPIVSIAVELFVLPGGGEPIFTIAKWFVFWSVGIRLFLAGVRQMFSPAYTAETIFHISDKAALKIVRELGVANFAIGVLGIAAIFERNWVFAAAIAGGLFYGLAGIQHARNSGRTRLQDIAMISDLGIFCVLAACLLVEFLRHTLG